MKKAHDILKHYWGYSSFRPSQSEVVQSILEGHDTLAVLPTGGGKSVCFQVPAMVQQKLCIVVSPLIALIKDQVDALNAKEIYALSIDSSMTYQEITIVLEKAIYDPRLRFLYVSPERLLNDMFLEYLSKMPVSHLVIDEAHCIVDWGYDFRYAYLKIAEIYPRLPKGVTKVALTASATPEVQSQIITLLEFKNTKKIIGDFRRKNLSFSALKIFDKEIQLVKSIRKINAPTIVYTRSRIGSEKLAKIIARHQIPTTIYHAGLSAEVRGENQTAFLENKYQVIVATNAFGMGIDKPDIRLVIHYDMPECLEAFYQEAGRAGRDGAKAYSLILYNETDIQNKKILIADKYPPYEEVKSIYKNMCDFFSMPIGSGMGQTIELDIDLFVSRFNIKKNTMMKAIYMLAAEGYLFYQDSYYHPPKLQFIRDSNNIISFQRKNPTYERLITTLLRYYGTEIFEMPCYVNEKYLAQNAGLVIDEWNRQRDYLLAMKMISYTSLGKLPTITYLYDRQDYQKLTFDYEKIKKAKTKDIARLDSLIEFLNEKKCKSVYVEKYFTNQSMDICGICDVCLSHAREAAQNIEQVAIQIIGHIQSHNNTIEIDALKTNFAKTSSTIFALALRYLMDKSLLTMVGHRITVTGNT